MAIGFNLKYSDGYEDLPQWGQFVKVLKTARGRKNMFIFRVITALINELELTDADGFQTLNAIEYWASDRLSAKPLSRNRSMIPEKSPPHDSSIAAVSASTVLASPENDPDKHFEHSENASDDGLLEPGQGNLFCGYDISAFRIT